MSDDLDALATAFERQIREIARQESSAALLEVGLLLIEVLLDGLGFKSDSERRAEIENHVSAIRRRYLNEAGTGDQLESADELNEAAPSLVSDRVADAVIDDGGDLTRHDSSPSLDARSGAGHTASVGENRLAAGTDEAPAAKRAGGDA